jgi:hypothetical protein
MRSIALLALMLFGFASAEGQPTAVTRTKQELTALFEKAVLAVKSRDTTALAKIYTSNYTFSIGGGDSVLVFDRADRLQSIAVSTDSISTLNLERCDIDLAGQTAVGRCWIRQRSVADAAGEWVGIYTTAVFTRGQRTGPWRILATHASVSRVGRRPRTLD